MQNAESRTSWPGCSTQCAVWALPLVHSPRQAPKPLDAWFFEAQALGTACPRPVGSVASRRLNRRRKRGGLSFGSAGWARSAARGCRAAVRRRVTRRGRAVRHASGHNRTDYTAIVGMGAHVCPCREAMTRQVTRHVRIRIVCHECSGLNTSKVLQLQLAISPQPLTRLRRFKNLCVAN